MIQNMFSRARLNPSDRSSRWIQEQFEAISLAVILLITLTFVGTVGFAVIEGWTIVDSFFMTVITLSTVGYSTVNPLSEVGKVFASILIMSGLSLTLYGFTVIGRTLLEGELRRFREALRMTTKIDEMSGHIVICGFGRLGRYVLHELDTERTDVVVIEQDQSKTEALREMGIPHVEGDACDDEVLKRAGITRASALLAVLASDADNVFVTLSAREFNPKVRILARAELENGERKLQRAGANQVIAPFRVSASRIVQQLSHKSVNDFLEIISDRHGTSLMLEQIIIPEGCALDGKNLEESEIRKRTGVTIAAVVDSDGEMKLEPSADTILRNGATVIALGTRDALNSFTREYC